MKPGAKPSRPVVCVVRWSVALAAAWFCAAGAQPAGTAPGTHADTRMAAANDVAMPPPVLEAVDAVVAAAVQLPVPIEPHPAREWWIWGALCVALLLLAGMVWSLFASLRKVRARG
jgi:hypothetical protein